MKANLTSCIVFVLLLTPFFSQASEFVFTPNADAQFEAALNAQLIELETAESLHPQRRFEESHYFFSPQRNIFGFDLGHGPFVAVQSGSKDAFDAVALGWMMGISHPNSKIKGWNIGMGLVVEADFKALTRGFLANDLNSDRYIHNRQAGTGLILMTSFSF